MKTTVYILLLFTTLFLFGCLRGTPTEKTPVHLNPNMDDQEKYQAQEQSGFFANKSAMRMPVEGTVARGQLRADDAYYFGKDANGNLLKSLPVKMTNKLLQRGRERYNIYCSPCHDQTGAGNGIVIQKGFMIPPSFHLDRIREMPAGHYFTVISNGIRNMPSYKHQVPVGDRWAIVAYIRALQLSQNASINDLPEEKRKELN